MDQDHLLLPEGGVLLHIGPYKTGSSALQASLHHSREGLREHGVRYAGEEIRAMRPGWGLIGKTPRGRPPATEREWLDLVEEVRSAPEPRVCVSTEDFARVGPQLVERIVRDLGADRLHVLCVVRRLDRLLPSQWQQRAQSFKSTTYDEYVGVVLDEGSDHADHKAFWGSHDVAATVGRWSAALDEQRFTLVVADESDRELLPRTVEQMLGLPDGMLAPEPDRNASLSLNAIEVLRRVNLTFAERGWPDDVYHQLIQTGMLHHLKLAGRPPGERTIPAVPSSAADRLRELSEQRAAAVEAMRVRVVGDPSSLRTVENVSDEPVVAPVETISMDSVVAAVSGVVAGMIALEEKDERRHRRSVAAARRAAASRRSVDQVPGRRLVRELVRRTKRRFTPSGAVR